MDVTKKGNSDYIGQNSCVDFHQQKEFILSELLKFFCKYYLIHLLKLHNFADTSGYTIADRRSKFAGFLSQNTTPIFNK
jgi:hypothetical protein